MKRKFTISVDTCSDLRKSFMEENRIYCQIVKRITNGKIIEEIFDSDKEFDDFYDSIRKGALPTTSQPNPSEFTELFEKILDNEEGDIIYVGLSTALSNNCYNAMSAAEELNKTLAGRKIYVIDSYGAALTIAGLVMNLMRFQDEGVDTAEAVRQTEEIRDRQQVWIIVDDLFHLKRSGRIGGFKAAIGTMLKVKPIIVFNNKGQLVVENNIKGSKKAFEYVLGKIEEFGTSKGHNLKGTFWLGHSCVPDAANELKDAITERFGDLDIRITYIGPIIGTHIGAGTLGIMFQGEKRLEIK